MNVVSRGPKNKKFYLWLCSCKSGWKPNFKNGKKTQKPRQKRLQEFRSEEKVRCGGAPNAAFMKRIKRKRQRL